MFRTNLGNDPDDPAQAHPLTSLTVGLDSKYQHPDENVTPVPSEKGFLYMVNM
jgi:hypothetical protein